MDALEIKTSSPVSVHPLKIPCSKGNKGHPQVWNVNSAPSAVLSSGKSNGSAQEDTEFGQLSGFRSPALSWLRCFPVVLF